MVRTLAALRAEAEERYARWDSVLDEQERGFRAAMTSDDVLDAPLQTGLRMDRDDFRRWSASKDRDSMLWYVHGEVWIVGVRSRPLSKLVNWAFWHLVEGVDKAAVLESFPLDELDGRLRMGESFFEATTGVYHQGWEPQEDNNIPIIIHAFDTWASIAYMRTVLDWLMQAPGVYLCVGLKPNTLETSPCIAIARWKDPDAAEGFKEIFCDGSQESLRVPLKACFEGDQVPPLLQAHSEKDVTIHLSRLALRYRKWCAMYEGTPRVT